MQVLYRSTDVNVVCRNVRERTRSDVLDFSFIGGGFLFGGGALGIAYPPPNFQKIIVLSAFRLGQLIEGVRKAVTRTPGPQSQLQPPPAPCFLCRRPQEVEHLWRTSVNVDLTY